MIYILNYLELSVHLHVGLGVDIYKKYRDIKIGAPLMKEKEEVFLLTYSYHIFMKEKDDEFKDPFFIRDLLSKNIY